MMKKVEQIRFKMGVLYILVAFGRSHPINLEKFSNFKYEFII